MKNPFFETWTTPFGAPPFDRITPEHFRPAYDRALAEHASEIAAIADDPAAPGFENVIVALEDSGQLLRQICPWIAVHPNVSLRIISSPS